MDQINSNRFRPTVSLNLRSTSPVPHLEEQLQGGADDGGGQVPGVDLAGDRVADGDVQMEVRFPSFRDTFPTRAEIS